MSSHATDLVVYAKSSSSLAQSARNFLVCTPPKCGQRNDERIPPIVALTGLIVDNSNRYLRSVDCGATNDDGEHHVNRKQRRFGDP